MAFVAFQMMFAVITPALITGATADRLKFGSYALFIAIWSIVVYAPAARWVFNPNGWLFKRGALDFAGGTAIHINAGIAALAVVAVIGNRRGYGDEAMPPHNLPLTMIGTGILWFGWFGFNAGSALAANGVAAQALVNTHLAAAAAMLGWLIVEKLSTGHGTTLGAASGAVAGLVAITPCAGFVGGASPADHRRWCRHRVLPRAEDQGAAAARRQSRRDRRPTSSAACSARSCSACSPISRPRASVPMGCSSAEVLDLLVDQIVASGSVLVFSPRRLVHHRPSRSRRRSGSRVQPDDEYVGLDRSQHASRLTSPDR
jgi:hypothetical protein